MKQLSLLLILILVFSCNKQVRKNSDIEYVSNSELIRIYDKVGALHNQILEIAYKGFKEGYITNHGGYKATIASYLHAPIGNVSKDAELSINVQLFLNRLEILYKSGKNTEYDKLQSEYLDRPDLTLLDRKSIIGSLSVLKASTTYWTPYNISKWKSLSPSVILYDGAKDIVFADAKGAAHGAVYGAIAGASGGTVTLPIVGTVAGAAAVGLTGMVFGAVGSSIDHAVTSWFKKLIGWSEMPACESEAHMCTREDSISWAKAHDDEFRHYIDSLSNTGL